MGVEEDETGSVRLGEQSRSSSMQAEPSASIMKVPSTSGSVEDVVDDPSKPSKPSKPSP